jgi:Ni,Fe-hydrogenase I small subunit
MGCKGPRAHSNCALVGWNDNTSWPVAVGHPCIGCTEPGFWDASSPFYRWMGESLLPAPGERERGSVPVGVLLGTAGAAAAAGAGTAALVRQRRARRADAAASDETPEGAPA